MTKLFLALIRKRMSVFPISIILTTILITDTAFAQKLLFPDEFKRPPGSDPGAIVTANVLPNSGGKIFYGQVGNQNVLWKEGEPEILDFPGKILETNADFSYVKGVITENESYYVFKDGEYTYINVNYPPDFSHLIVVYFSEVNNMVIGWATKIIPGVNAKARAVQIHGNSWQVIGDDPPLSDFAFSYVSAVRGENGSIIIGHRYMNDTGEGFRLENGTFDYFFSSPYNMNTSSASPDGNVIVGHGPNVDLQRQEAYKWQNGQISLLGHLGPGFGWHISTSVNNEGNIVLGYTRLTGNQPDVAFIWIEDRGIMKLSDYISSEYEIEIPGERIRTAYLSEDQSNIIGTIGYADNRQRSYILLLKETDDRIVVNSTADRPLNIANSTDCSTGELIDINGEMVTECTLRAAIETAINRYNEGSEKPGNISFQIPGTEAQIIAVTSPLPEITAPIEIDGSAQITNLGLPLVYIDGQAAGVGANGFNIMHDDVTLKNFAVYGFDGHGIYVTDVEDIRLEGLIVGTDADATPGIGNKGDGIHISGNAKVRVGGEVSQISPLASTNLGSGVATLGNGRHGIAVVSTDIEDKFNILKSNHSEPYDFKSDEEPAIQLFNMSIGLLKTHETKELENMGAGAYAYGEVMAIDNAAFGPSGGPGLHIVAAHEAAHAVIQNASFGKKKETISQPDDIVSPQQKSINSSIVIEFCRGIMIGSPNPEDNPIEAIGSSGYFIEVKESEDVRIANVLSGTVKNPQNVTSFIAEHMRNLLGSIHIENSNRVGIGAIGLPTVISNSGTQGDSVAAGILASGTHTRALEIVNVIIGGMEGLEGTGVAGDGIRIENGVSDFSIGGEDEDEAVIVAGNDGYALHVANNNETTFSTAEAREAMSRVVNFFTDVLEPGNMESALPNQGGAIKISNSMNLNFKKISIGPTTGHGMEITGNLSRTISIIQSSIGSSNNSSFQDASQIEGPKGDGIHITDASDIQIGDDTPENLVSILGSAGRGISILQGKGITVSNVNVGDVSIKDAIGEISEVLFKSGNKLGGIFIGDSDSVMVKNSSISNNGSSEPNAGGGISARQSNNIQIFANRIGKISDTSSGNQGAAVDVDSVHHIFLNANKIAGNLVGVLAKYSNVHMNGNIIEKQKDDDGESGHGVSVQGGFLNATRNVISNNEGIGINLEDVIGATILLNDILSNYNGLVLKVLNQINKSAGENGSLVYAGENWWGDASGPGGEGPGTGDAVYGNVDYSNWLSAPVGVAIVPQEHLISLKSDQDYVLPVSVANHLEASDQLTITITDSLGWYSGNNTFSVPVVNFEYTNASLAFTPIGSQSNINLVKIKAVSQNNPDLSSEVKIYFVPEDNVVNLENLSLAGTSILDAGGGPFQIGDEIIIGHGLANEETGTIADFGSIVLENPLKFSHAPGERVFTISNLYTSAREIISEIPFDKKFVLGSNYPNPFAASTKIPFEITETGKVEIFIIDNLGRTIISLVNQTLPAGKHEITFEGATMPEGMYFYQIRGNGFSESRKMVKTR